MIFGYFAASITMEEKKKKNTTKRVLFISYDGLTDSLGQSQILPYLLGLSAKGHKITVVSCDKQQNYRQNATDIKEKVQAAGIDWRSTPYQTSPPILFGILNKKRLKQLAQEVIKEKKIELLHCRSIIPAIIGKELSRKYGCKLIFDIRGFWADERVEGGIWDLKKPIYRFLYRYFKKQEKRLFEEADCIISLTENARSYIDETFNTKKNYQVIPCAVDVEHFSPDKIVFSRQRALKEKLGIQESDYVLTYVGSLGTRYLLREMLQFFKALLKQNERACFLFISKSDTATIYTIAQELSIPHDRLIITSCEYRNIPEYIALGNASIFFIVSSFTGKAVSPTKQAEVLSLGLPIVGNAGLGDTDKVLRDREVGVLVDAFSETVLKEKVNELLNLKPDRDKIRASAIKNFSLQHAVEKYHTAYTKL
jgi:glycosyltransferase involved in cell wall biosynthesis